MVASDIFLDSKEGAHWWHLLSEAIIGLSAGFCIYFVLKDSFYIRQTLEVERKEFAELKEKASHWKEKYKKHIEGLSLAIDQQLSSWALSTSEKEVALLLLKGLSLKEIADIRNTTEKTTRAQSAAIYLKSNLSGRSELAAFFLEDLLLPQVKKD